MMRTKAYGELDEYDWMGLDGMGLQVLYYIASSTEFKHFARSELD